MSDSLAVADRNTLHVTPVGDLVVHDSTGDDCVCGPTTEPVPRSDGSIAWLVVHHSLDGRVQQGPGHG